MIHRDAAQLYRQLSATTRAGIPVGLALPTITSQTRNKSLRKCLSVVADGVWQGKKLSDALSACPNLFDGYQRAAITASEAVGRVDVAFDELAQAVERSAALQDALKRELLFPKITLACSLPFLLVFFGHGSSVATSLVVVVLLTIFLAVLTLQQFLSRTETRQNPHSDLLAVKVPLLKGVSLLSATARFMRSLAMLHRSGVETTQAVRLAAGACGSEVIAGKLRQAVRHIERGEPLQDALRTTGVFAPHVIAAVGVGEFPGSIDALLDCVADYHEQELALWLHEIAVTLGVIALLAVGVLVGLICVTFYTGAKL